MSAYVNFEQNLIIGGQDITEKVNVDILMLDISISRIQAHIKASIL